MAVICKPIGNLEKNEYWEVLQKRNIFVLIKYKIKKEIRNYLVG
jgi:hypothetical protein